MEPHFTNLFDLTVDPDTGRIRICLADDAKQGICFTVPATMAPSIVVGIAAQAGKLAVTSTATSEEVASAIDVHEVEPALGADGVPMLLLKLRHGLELPLRFEGETLGQLINILTLLNATPPSRPT